MAALIVAKVSCFWDDAL